MGRSKTHLHSNQAFCLMFATWQECGTLPNISCSMETDSMSHYHIIAWPDLIEHSTNLRPSTLMHSSSCSSWPGYWQPYKPQLSPGPPHLHKICVQGHAGTQQPHVGISSPILSDTALCNDDLGRDPQLVFAVHNMHTVARGGNP
jgi:hypothetical protein